MDLVIFDLDGTLIDTEPSAAQAVERAFAGWGIALAGDDARFVTGRTWESAFEHLFSRYPLPIPPEQAKREILELYRDSLERELVVVPGSVAAVEALSARFPLGLVSGSHRREVLWALGKLGVLERFRVVLGSEDYPRSKPAPDGFLSAMKTIGATGPGTLVFEDSRAGLEAARAAGAWAVAVTGTNHFAQDLSAAHHHIPDLTGVTAEWVKTLSEKLLSSTRKSKEPVSS